MKSFLDRFRRKGTEKEQGKKPGVGTSSDVVANETLQQGYTPKLKRREGVIPTRSAPREPVSREPAPVAPSAPAEVPSAPSQPRKEETISFEVGDFLPRIPEQLLAPGEHDPKTQLIFDVGELSARIAKGQTTIPLMELYRRVPNIFGGEISEADNIEIRFPWQKLLELVKTSEATDRQSGLSESAADALAQKLRARKRNVGFSGAVGGTERAQPRLPGASAGPGPARQPSWFSRPTTERAAAAAAASAAAPAGSLTLPTAPVKVESNVVPQTKPLAPAAPVPSVPEGLSTAPEFAVVAHPAVPATPSSAPVEKVVPADGPAAAQESAPTAEAEGAAAGNGGQEQLAAAQSEFERRIETFEEEKRQLAAARDAALADLAKVLQEIDEHRDEAEMQRSLAEQTGHTAVKAASEREAMYHELEQLRSHLDARTAEVTTRQQQIEQSVNASANQVAVVEKLRAEFQEQMAALQAEAIKRAEEFTALQRQLDEFKKSSEEQITALKAERDQLLAEKKSTAKKLTREKSFFDQLQHTAEAGLAAVVEERDRLKSELEQRAKDLAFTETRLAEVERNASVNLTAIPEERDRLQGEVASVSPKAAELEAQLTAAKEATQGEIAALSEERERFRTEAESRAEQLSTLQGELSQVRAALDSRLSSLTEERDALVQQKTHLSEQLVQLQKGGPRPESQQADGERNKREHQRQTEELQRRITALESSQRENAQELTREREARIKAERTASAADRARGEAVALVESMRNDMRRDSDANARKRDAEFARAQKDLQDKIEALTDSVRKLQSERDEFASEIARHRESAREAEAAAAAAANDWGSRATASFEADIENYRSRIKALLKEKDGLLKERDQLAVAAQESSALEEFKRANEGLAKELEVARAEREHLAAESAKEANAVGELRSEKGKLESALEAAQREREQLAAELAKQTNAVSELRIQVEKLASALEAAQREREQIAAEAANGSAGQEKLATELDAARTERDRLAQELRDHAAEQQKQAAGIEAAHRELAEANTARVRQGEEFSRLQQAHTTLVQDSTKQRDNLLRERDVARKRAESLQAEIDELLTGTTAGIAAEEEMLAMQRQLEQNRRASSALALERDQLKQALAATTAELATTASFAADAKELVSVRADLEAAQATGEKLTAELEAAQEEAKAALAVQTQLRQEQNALEIVRGALEQNLASLTRDRDVAVTSTKNLEAKVNELQGFISARETEMERVQSEHEHKLTASELEKRETISNLQAELTSQVAALQKERDELSAELNTTRERAKVSLRNQEKQVTAQIAALTEERDVARRESSAVAQRLAGMAVESDEKVGSLQRRLDALAEEKAAATKELESLKAESDQQSAIFARELKAAVVQRDEAFAASETARELLKKQSGEFTRERADIERSVEERLARLERDVTRLRRERDALLRQKEELRDKMGDMVQQQQKFVEDLTTRAGKQAAQPTDIGGRTQDLREPNVIDITEAEILQPGEPDSGGVRPPRVRPMMVPPPNLRVI